MSSEFWYGLGRPLFGVVHSAVPLPTTASPTLQGALKGGSGEVVVARDMPEPSEIITLQSLKDFF